MMGTWVLYIPRVKDQLGIDEAELGFALFFFALGTLSMIPFASKIIDSIGVGKSTLWGIIIYVLSFLFPVIAPSYYSLCAALFFTGMAGCFTDISMNALVSEIERQDQVNFMSAAHGFFSLGGVIGAGIGSLLIIYFSVPWQHMVLIGGIVILINVLIAKSYFSIKGKPKEKSESSFNWSLLKPLLGLTIISFLIMGSEGAIEHWSKLYLTDIVKVISEQIAGFGFVAFSATMTLGRFLGDYVSQRFGPMKIIIAGCLIGIFGFLAILSTQLILTMIGFGLVGMGYSVIIPELFRLAGTTKGVSPSEGISFVAGFGYIGFLVSPAFLGFLAKLGTLKLSFLALMIAAGIAMFTASFLRVPNPRI